VSRFDPKTTQIYAAQIVLALEHVHDQDILYRDIKPENVMIHEDGYLKLTDFGLATEHSLLAKTFCGSPAYLSPEMIRRKGVTKESDLYGLGAVIFEMLSGYPPYYSDSICELFVRIKYAKLKFPKYVEPVARDLLKKLLNRDPAERPSIPEIKAHEFFSDINWDLLKNKQQGPALD
jgi:serum/glucocorticoid-regulated kinase 2